MTNDGGNGETPPPPNDAPDDGRFESRPIFRFRDDDEARPGQPAPADAPAAPRKATPSPTPEAHAPRTGEAPAEIIHTEGVDLVDDPRDASALPPTPAPARAKARRAKRKKRPTSPLLILFLVFAGLMVALIGIGAVTTYVPRFNHLLEVGPPTVSTESLEPEDQRPLTEATRKKIEARTRQVVEAVSTERPQAFLRFVNQEAFLQRVLWHVERAGHARMAGSPGFAQGLREGMGQGFSKMSRELGEGQMDLLRVRGAEGEPRALLRLQQGGGFGYLELSWRWSPEDGRWKIVEQYNYNAGAPASRIFAEVAVGLMGGRNIRENTINAKRLDQISKALEAGNPQAAYQYLKQLPQEFRTKRAVLLLEYRISLALQDMKHNFDVLKRLERHHPDHKGIKILLLDLYYIRKEYEKVYETIAALDAMVGGDPYLQEFRAGILREEGRMEEAYQAARASYEAGRRSENTLAMLLSTASNAGHLDQAMTAAQELRERYGYTSDQIAEVSYVLTEQDLMELRRRDETEDLSE